MAKAWKDGWSFRNIVLKILFSTTTLKGLLLSIEGTIKKDALPFHTQVFL